MTVAESASPLATAATMRTVPTATPVTMPAAVTVATSGSRLVHVNAAETGASSASNAAAASATVAPTVKVAVLGVTSTRATTSGSSFSVPSLHAPKVAAAGASQVPAGFRCSENPIGVVPVSSTPMSTDVKPMAGPSTAAKVPSYDRNSTTAPPASISAIPSGLPFWMPFTG